MTPAYIDPQSHEGMLTVATWLINSVKQYSTFVWPGYRQYYSCSTEKTFNISRNSKAFTQMVEESWTNLSVRFDNADVIN